MDPVLDPSPFSDQPPAAVPDADFVDEPPYAEMIRAAISALNEPNGSTKRAISKYIGENHPDLPSTHEDQLTEWLRRLKINGQLLMVKNSYMLPRFAPPSTGSKRRPGRPPKSKMDVAQVAVPVFQLPTYTNSIPVNGPSTTAVTPVRRRGRPPKLHRLKRSPSGSPKASGPRLAATVSGRPRGRPPGSSPGRPRGRPLGSSPGRPRGRPPGGSPGRPRARPPGSSPGRSRGRPRKPINAVGGPSSEVAPGGVGVGVVPSMISGGVESAKRSRGRPPKKAKSLSGKSLGPPPKTASPGAAKRGPDSHLLGAYLDLKAKLENLQWRIGQTANFVKPYVNNEAAIDALKELELISENITVPPRPQD